MSRLIAIDDGHGMATAGKRTPIFPDGTKSPETGKNFMHENEFNRAVKRYLKEELERCGFRTILVAPTDDDTPLSTRVAVANNANADLYVSIHANANTSQWGTWGGAETYTWGSGESLRIGRIIHRHLMQGTPLRDRGVKDGSWLYVIKNTRMPAVLVECAFMDNLEEAKLLLSDSFRRECAREIAMGICEAYGVQYVEAKGNKGEIDMTREEVVQLIEEVIEAKMKLDPSNLALKNAISTVLMRFQTKEPPLSEEWREKAVAKELSIHDAIALLYIAIERSYIQGKGNNECQ